MTWTTPQDLRDQLTKQWDRGDLLASLVTGKAIFPKRLILKGPASAEMADRLNDVRRWVAEIASLPHGRVVTRLFTHRTLGANTIPAEVWVDTLSDAIAWLHKQQDVARFGVLIETTYQQEPLLLAWLAQKPLRALALVGEWERLLAIVGWLRTHPRPQLFLRQVDIPGVHSKFIEAHRGVLKELFDIAVPEHTGDASAADIAGFCRRYGFREKPHRIRFRILDETLARTMPGEDMTIDVASFAHLNPRISRVFMTENEINFLAFPRLKESLIIFGAGYGFTPLKEIGWLSHVRLYYWGDIDTHGFAILNQLRGACAHATSFLMDEATLWAFESHWTREEMPVIQDLPHLTREESLLYNRLRDNAIRPHVRLEQERIGFNWVESALSQLS